MRGWAAVFCVSSLLVGCSDGPAPAPPVLLSAAEVEPMLRWSADLDGRRVAIDGYVNIDNGPGGQAIALRPQLTTRPFGRGDALISFDVEQGAGPDQLDLPALKTQTLPDVPGVGEIQLVDMNAARFQDTAGVAYSVRQKVRVTGRVTYARWSRRHLRSEEDRRSPTGQRFRPLLTEVTLEAAPSTAR